MENSDSPGYPEGIYQTVYLTFFRPLKLVQIPGLAGRLNFSTRSAISVLSVSLTAARLRRPCLTFMKQQHKTTHCSRILDILLSSPFLVQHIHSRALIRIQTTTSELSITEKLTYSCSQHHVKNAVGWMSASFRRCHLITENVDRSASSNRYIK